MLGADKVIGYVMVVGHYQYMSLLKGSEHVCGCHCFLNHSARVFFLFSRSFELGILSILLPDLSSNLKICVSLLSVYLSILFKLTYCLNMEKCLVLLYHPL